MRIHDRNRRYGRILDERQQPAGDGDRVASTDCIRNGVGSVSGSARGARPQLNIHALASGIFGHRAEMARVRSVLPDEQRRDGSHGEQHSHEGRARIFEF